MNNAQRELLVKRLADHEEMDRSIHGVVHEALRRHKEMGNSIAVWQNDQVVIVPAEEIDLSEELPLETEPCARELVRNSAG